MYNNFTYCLHNHIVVICTNIYQCTFVNKTQDKLHPNESIVTMYIYNKKFRLCNLPSGIVAIGELVSASPSSTSKSLCSSIVHFSILDLHKTIRVTSRWQTGNVVPDLVNQETKEETKTRRNKNIKQKYKQKYNKNYQDSKYKT